LLFPFSRDWLTSHGFLAVILSSLNFRFLVGDGIDGGCRSAWTDPFWFIGVVGMHPAHFEITWTAMKSIVFGLEIGKNT